jgi:hypothetical protein
MILDIFRIQRISCHWAERPNDLMPGDLRRHNRTVFWRSVVEEFHFSMSAGLLIHSSSGIFRTSPRRGQCREYPSFGAINLARGGESRRLCSAKLLLWWVFSEVLFDALCESLYPVRVHLSLLMQLDYLLRRQHEPHYFKNRTALPCYALGNRDSLLLEPGQTGV